MTNEELLNRIEELEFKLNMFVKPGKYVFNRDVSSQANTKLGFMGANPITKFSSGIGRSTVSGNTGTPATIECQWNGEVGSKFYSVGDLVRALKDYGLIE